MGASVMRFAAWRIDGPSGCRVACGGYDWTWPTSRASVRSGVTVVHWRKPTRDDPYYSIVLRIRRDKRV